MLKEHTAQNDRVRKCSVQILHKQLACRVTVVLGEGGERNHHVVGLTLKPDLEVQLPDIVVTRRVESTHASRALVRIADKVLLIRENIHKVCPVQEAHQLFPQVSGQADSLVVKRDDDRTGIAPDQGRAPQLLEEG